ncbi:MULTISPECIES: hypothetical protein [Methanobacterium]|uniref:Uncharacterized protein n=1 Tax=Methanobacterium veterum TaxID=408577 RepID=A0A9E5A3I1_9EURY|nr:MULTISPECIES: hypothetical protein [Methanobacterium]MCZ3364765.1 hypothetical protein [Methanobacterium veterum]MCZ3372519.1 hypothetical protein [Methanobacterium veterum]
MNGRVLIYPRDFCPCFNSNSMWCICVVLDHYCAVRSVFGICRVLWVFLPVLSTTWVITTPNIITAILILM